jgi:hypothetical protein
MARTVICECVRCARKPLVLRQISSNLARKHLKTYGPAHVVLVPPGPAPQANANQGVIPPPAIIPEPPIFDDHEAYEFGADALADYGGVADEEDHEELPEAGNNNAPVLPSDTAYTTIEIPDGPCPNEDIDLQDIGSVLPPAFRDREPSHIRMAYLQAVINNVYRNMSVLDASENLEITLDTLDVAGALPAYPRPVRTLASAKRRIGVRV